jgi:HPr Serine kinase C-terminal domain
VREFSAGGVGAKWGRLPLFDVPASDWFERADQIGAAPGASAGCHTAFRLGDAVLEVSSDCDALIGELADHYGECEIALADPQTQALPSVRCTVSSVEEGRLALLHFEPPLAVAPFDIGLGLLKHPVTNPEYVEGMPQPDGWRPIVHVVTGKVAAAGRGRKLLVDVPLVGARVLGRLLVDAVLSLQRALLFAHAASVGIGGTGVLLVGPSGSGKTTTAVGLASRGHRYFGDDVGAVRMQSAELIPFWRIAHMRPGPHARSLESHFATGEWDAPYADGLPRLRLRVVDAFPDAVSRALPLGRVLFLRRFTARPRIERFTPTASDFAAGSRFALNNTLWVAWGTTPALRLLQFMSFLRMLERVPCAWLDVADPESTADLIESSQEDPWH